VTPIGVKKRLSCCPSSVRQRSHLSAVAIAAACLGLSPPQSIRSGEPRSLASMLASSVVSRSLRHEPESGVHAGASGLSTPISIISAIILGSVLGAASVNPKRILITLRTALRRKRHCGHCAPSPGTADEDMGRLARHCLPQAVVSCFFLSFFSLLLYLPAIAMLALCDGSRLHLTQPSSAMGGACHSRHQSVVGAAAYYGPQGAHHRDPVKLRRLGGRAARPVKPRPSQKAARASRWPGSFMYFCLAAASQHLRTCARTAFAEISKARPQRLTVTLFLIGTGISRPLCASRSAPRSRDRVGIS